MKKRNITKIISAFLLSWMLVITGIIPNTSMTGYAAISGILSAQTAEFLKNMDINAVDGRTYRFNSFSEDYVIYVFGRTSCPNTQTMMTTIDKIQNTGMSVRKVFMPVDNVDSGLSDFIKKHPTNLTCATASSGNGTKSWTCIRYENLNGSTLPFVFVLNRAGSLVWAGEAYEPDSLFSFFNNISKGLIVNPDKNTKTVYSVSYQVKYGQTEARKILSMVNSFRTGGNAWYWDSSNSKKVYKNQLQPLDYDYELEKAAMIRAAEIGLYYNHARPDGSSCFSAYTYKSAGENIAIGFSSASAVFEAWREDDEPYSGQGHRRNMLSESNTAMAVGHAVVNGTHCWVQEFRSPSGSMTLTNANDSTEVFTTEVSSEHLGEVSISLKTTGIEMKQNETRSVPEASVLIRNKGLQEKGSNYSSQTVLYDITPDVYIEDSSIAGISGNTIYALKAGTTKLIYTITVAGKTAKKTIPITITGASGSGNKNNTGLSVIQSGIKYKLQSGGNATITGYTGNLGSYVSIPSSISVNGKSYAVTVIGKKAFKGSAITKLTGGSKLRSIGAGCFAKCRNLSSIDLSSAELNSIGKNAFKGCSDVSSIWLNVSSLSSVGMNAFLTGSWEQIDVKLVGSPSSLALARSMLITAGLPSSSFSEGSDDNGNGNNTGNNNGYTLNIGWYRSTRFNFRTYIKSHYENAITMQMERISDGKPGNETVYKSIGNNEYRMVTSDGLSAKIVVESNSSFTWTVYDEKGVRMMQREYVYEN